MHPFLHTLSGGDRRSVGESNRAVLAVLECPELIGVLFQGLETPDPILRMRCADAIEKVTANRPELLLPFKKTNSIASRSLNNRKFAGMSLRCWRACP